MKKKVTIATDYMVYQPKEEERYLLSTGDWNRLKDMVAKIKPALRIYQILSNTLIGVFVSSVFSLIALGAIRDAPLWVRPTTWAIMVSSFILGACLQLLDLQQKRIISLNSDDIVTEMIRIEGRYRE